MKLIYLIPCLLFSSTLIFHNNAAADPPPNLPLPDCVVVDGEQQGACPATNDALTGQAGGRFSAGATLAIATVPTDGICIMVGPWTPSLCYSAVSAPGVASCGVIDLLDGEKFKEMSCQQALYKEPQSAPNELFSLVGGDGSRCGAAGNFQTYIYGGPANVPGARWSEFGPEELNCNLTFNGSRPDGLYGPT